MTNADIAGAIDHLAKLLELLGEDSFRVNAHAKAARAIDNTTADLAAIARLPDARKQLIAMDGIGPKIADKIVELATTGVMKDAQDAQAKVPAGLVPLLQLQGLGPKTVRMLWQEAGVTDLASLKRIVDDGSILTLPRMGQKAVDKLKIAISIAGEAGQRLALGRATVVAERVIAYLKDCASKSLHPITRIEAAGSLRRGRDTVGDLDILVESADPAAVSKAFTTMPGVTQVLVAGESRASVRVAVKVPSRWEEATGDAAGEKAKSEKNEPPPSGASIQVDLRVIPAHQWGAALAYFTGSKEHNVLLRQRALDRGLTLNEYGLYPNDAEPTPPHTRGIKAVASRTEEEIHTALGLPYIPPEIREGRGEQHLTATPRLIEIGDIKAELHAHTTASDGVMSIIQLATEAKRRGFHTITVTDHSQSSALAGGLKPKALREHIKAIHAAREHVPGITILAGSEVDILSDGALDYDDELLAELDVVVASPHAALSQDSVAATERLIRAVSHPMVHILGHPTGRLILKRRGLEPDMAAVIAAAKAHDTALEINAHWMRLDLRDLHARQALEAGCLLAIDCDVHHPDDFDNLRFGITTARRAWCEPKSCINTWSAKDLHAWLKR